MRIYTKAGDLAFTTFTFPDGQPHFKLETLDVDFRDATIETSIRNPTELLQVLLANDVLRQSGYATVNLEIRYLMAARMDRAISPSEPFSLAVVAKLLNGCGFTRVRVLDAHSDAATRLIRNSANVLPFHVVDQVFTALPNVHHVVSPDKGAVDRVSKLAVKHLVARTGSFIQGTKFRKMSDGSLSGFEIVGCPGTGGWDCLIIDDICDGGGTFVGLAAKLKEMGAAKIHLYVTHGIFSKPLPLEGIDTIYTTDSYRPDTYGVKRVVCIPVSMKEMS